MATTTLTLRSERWLDEVLLLATVADVGAASLTESFLLPAGLGDVAIMSMTCAVTAIATVPVTATLDRGIRAVIFSPDASTVVDIVGVAQWFACGGDAAAFTRVDAYLDPDALCLWRQTEILVISSPEMDAGATGDLQVIIKTVRVRPIDAPIGQGPIQLVR